MKRRRDRKEHPSSLAIGLEHVTKEYRLGVLGKSKEIIRALDDVSLTIAKGERIGILGHNGAGKSTLLKLICRITAPTAGIIGYNGKISSMLEVGTGFHTELTGKENIYLNGSILGMSKEEIDEKLESIVAFSGMERFMDTPVKRYSSGMYVRLAFSVAAHLNADIVIMDEVLAVGDQEFQRQGLARMRQIAEEEGRTILYVSHNMENMRSLCHRGLVLEQGALIYDGDIEGAIARYSR